MSSPVITGCRIEMSFSGEREDAYVSERAVNFEERSSRWKGRVWGSAFQCNFRSPGHTTPSVEPRDINRKTSSGTMESHSKRSWRIQDAYRRNLSHSAFVG